MQYILCVWGGVGKEYGWGPTLVMCTGVKMRVAEKVAQQGGTYCTACVLADTALKRVNSRRAEIRKKATSEGEEGVRGRA